MRVETIRVLLIDDDEDDAFLVRELFADATEVTGRRYRVDWKDDYEGGLAAALRREHDVALVDYQLLPGSGLELIQRAREAGCDTPFILLTGLAGQEIDEKAAEVGAADFLAKGSTDAALLERTVRYSLRHAATLNTLAAKTRELERSNQELEQFARAISHDLRQPLHSIAGYTELLTLRLSGPLDAETREMVDRILRGVERMNRMIEDLLGLARIDADGESLEAVDLTILYGGVLEELQEHIHETGARVAAGPLPVVRGRPAHLQQLLRNLVGNALKFVGTDAPRVTVTCEADGDLWHLQVKDNGIGVPEDQREAIFEPFHRGHPEQPYEGTGVGLALCAKIAQQHGGRIWVDAAPGGGSCFHVTLSRDLRTVP